ncbi:hypothetical protein SprV_0902680600 [Sparganum proliferum]
MSLKRQGKQSREEKNVVVETDTKTGTSHATNARGKTQGGSLPSEDIYGAKDPDQDCDMVTALDRDALTPTELKFLEAARTNRCNILTSILARPNFNVNVRTNLNRTALHMAASQGHLEAVQLLVKAKSSIDAVDKHGMTPLFWAAFRDHVDVVLYLLESGAGPQRRTKRGYSLLHVVAKADAIKTMEALLRRGIITDLCEYDNNDMTPLMIAASSGSVLSTTVLSKLGHIEDHIDQHQRNLLHMAVPSGSSDVVAVLCQNPASSALINEFDEDGMTPLQYAVKELNYDCVEILLAHGAKPNIKSPKATFPIIMAAQKGDVEMVRILISGKARIKKKNRSGNTPLHVASMANHVGVVMELLQAGADVEVRNKRLQPPLIAAVEQNSAEATEVLLLSGADMNKVDAAAKTALNLAAQSGFARIVDLLIKADRFRTKHPDFADELAKNLRGVADRTDSTASISETGTFTGSLSPSEFEQRSKEAGVVLINDQIVVLGSQSATSQLSPERSEDSDFSISQASTYKSSDSETPSSKMSSSPAAAVATSKAGSGLTNGTTAEAKQTPAAKTESLASSTAPGMKVKQDKAIEEDNGSHLYENIAPDRGKKRNTLSELAGRARADRQSGSVASTEAKADQKQAKNGSLVYENIPSGRDSALPLRKPSTGVSRPNSAAGTPAPELPSSQRVHSIAGDHAGAGGAQIVTKDSSSRKVSAPTSRGGEQIGQPGVYIAQTSPGSLAGSEGLSQISQMEYRLLTFNQPFAAQFQPLLYHLAYNKLKKEDWKKLAVFWGFTDEQIAAIELHHSQSPKAYKDHGFRMLSIWLHGVEANETPTEGLSAALIAIGEKSRADRLQQDYHKVLHGHKSWRDKLDVSSRRRRSVL